MCCRRGWEQKGLLGVKAALKEVLQSDAVPGCSCPRSSAARMRLPHPLENKAVLWGCKPPSSCSVPV
ncbi:unnamed protein product [Gadus morhua 'NCC']